MPDCELIKYEMAVEVWSIGYEIGARGLLNRNGGGSSFVYWAQCDVVL